MFGFIFSLLIGALAGSIAGRIMGSETSALRNIVLGILGSFVGGGGLVGLPLPALWVRSSSRSSEPVSACHVQVSSPSKSFRGESCGFFCFCLMSFSRTML